LFLAHSTLQDKDVLGGSIQQISQVQQMIGPPCE